MTDDMGSYWKGIDRDRWLYWLDVISWNIDTSDQGLWDFTPKRDKYDFGADFAAGLTPKEAFVRWVQWQIDQAFTDEEWVKEEVDIIESKFADETDEDPDETDEGDDSFMHFGNVSKTHKTFADETDEGPDETGEAGSDTDGMTPAEAWQYWITRATQRGYHITYDPRPGKRDVEARHHTMAQPTGSLYYWHDTAKPDQVPPDDVVQYVTKSWREYERWLDEDDKRRAKRGRDEEDVYLDHD